MMFNLIYSGASIEEFKEAVKWYEEKRGGLGNEFYQAILEKIKLINENPERYPIRKSYYRETSIKRFPYIIVYRQNKKNRIITIIAIYHTSRNPKSKYRR